MSRSSVSLLVLVLLLVLLLWLAPSFLLTVFAGLLMALFLRSGGDAIAARTGMSSGAALGVFCLALATVTIAFFALAGAALTAQAQQLIDQLPAALDMARGYVDGNPWVQRLIDQIDPQSLMPKGDAATTALSTTFGAFANTVLIVFIGIYGAIEPDLYRRGAVALVAPRYRPRASAVLADAGIAVRGWLRAQFISMAVVGVLTGLGLWALGVSLAPILAVLAAILTFIPNIGPVIAAVPAVLLGLTQGGQVALFVIGLYVVVQTIESYLITPNVQKEAVSLPPALTIAVQVLFGTLFGIIGLAMATPLAAVALRVGQRHYVRDYLEGDTGQVQTAA